MKQKKILYYYLFFLLPISTSLLSYDQSAIDALNAGSKNLIFKDFSEADLSQRNLNGIDFTGSIFTQTNLSESTLNSCNLSSADLTKGNLSGTNFNNCTLSDVDFTEANMSGSITNSSNLNRAVFVDLDMRSASLIDCTYQETALLKAIIEDTNKNFIVRSGAISESCCYMVNSDAHSITFAITQNEKQRTLNDQKKQLRKMFSVATEKNIKGQLKNNITKIIYTGDNTENGIYPADWGVFAADYLTPYKTGIFAESNKIPTLLLIGNHDRHMEHVFEHKTYITHKINSWNSEYIEETGDVGQDYYMVSNTESNSHIFMLSECPTRNGYKPFNWFKTKYDKTKNCVLASHYTPQWNYDWWTDLDETNWGETAYGIAIMAEFGTFLQPYSDNIKLYIGGHSHQILIERWNIGNNKKIWVLDTAGRNRFALVHLDSSGNIICIEIYHRGEWEEVLRFFPQLEDSTNSDGHKTRLIVKYYKELHNKFPSINEREHYLNSGNTLWENYIDIKLTSTAS